MRTDDALLVQRAPIEGILNMVSWQGEQLGAIVLGPEDLPTQVGRVVQAPDGRRFLAGKWVLAPDRPRTDAAGVLGTSAPPVWTDDSRGLCAIAGDVNSPATLVRATLPAGQVVRLALPSDVGFAGQLGPELLACSVSRGVAVVALTDLHHRATVVVIGLRSGSVLLRRAFTHVERVAASLDGRLLGLSTELPGEGGGLISMTVIDTQTGRTVFAREAGFTIVGFSGDDRRLIAVSNTAAQGVEVLSVAGGGKQWGDPDHALSNWTTHPGAGDFAVLLLDAKCPGASPLAGSNASSCPPGGPGALVLVPPGGVGRAIGEGFGAWDWR